MKHSDLKKELLKNKEFYKKYYSKDTSYEIGRMVKLFRIKKGMTQGYLAKILKTKQSSIARLENGSSCLPSLSFLEKIAIALEAEFVPPSFKESLRPNTEVHTWEISKNKNYIKPKTILRENTSKVITNNIDNK